VAYEYFVQLARLLQNFQTFNKVIYIIRRCVKSPPANQIPFNRQYSSVEMFRLYLTTVRGKQALKSVCTAVAAIFTIVIEVLTIRLSGYLKTRHLTLGAIGLWNLVYLKEKVNQSSFVREISGVWAKVASAVAQENSWPLSQQRQVSSLTRVLYMWTVESKPIQVFWRNVVTIARFFTGNPPVAQSWSGCSAAGAPPRHLHQKPMGR